MKLELLKRIFQPVRYKKEKDDSFPADTLSMSEKEIARNLESLPGLTHMNDFKYTPSRLDQSCRCFSQDVIWRI